MVYSVNCLIRSIIDFSLRCPCDDPLGSKWRLCLWPVLATAAIDLGISIGS